MNPSDNEDDAMVVPNVSVTQTKDSSNKNGEPHISEAEEVNESYSSINSPSSETKESNDDEPNKEQQSVEEIVSNILMQKKEFQKRLEKHLQRNPSNLHNSILKYSRQRQDTIIDSSEDEEYTDVEDKTNGGNNDNRLRTRVSRREQCFVRAVNAYNQRSFRSQYDSFRNVEAKDSVDLIQRLNSSLSPVKSTIRSSNHEKRSPGESFKKPNIIVGSKLIRTALRIREDCDSASEHEEQREEPIYEVPMTVKKNIEEDQSKFNYFKNYF